MILYLITAVFVLAADQLTKYLVSAKLALGSGFVLIPHIMNIRYVQNTGAAFSILGNGTMALGIISMVFSAAIVIYWLSAKPKNPLLCSSLALLFAGALGNGIDRLARHYVIDFLDTAFIDFPVFNVADIAVTVGAALFILYELLSERGKKKNNGK